MKQRKLYSGNAQLIIYEFPHLIKHKNLFHGILTRHGGVSPPPFNSLNLDSKSGDNPHYVKENLSIVRDSISSRALVFPEQVHGKRVKVIKSMPESSIYQCGRADALITDLKGVALLTRHADCQGILLYDTVKNVISNIHCGWRGSVINIIDETISKMRAEFGSNPEDILAGIGPSLGPCCAEFIDWKDIFPEEFLMFRTGENHFNLWELSKWQLERAGVKRENILISGICTRCRTDLFYSYRGEGKTGRSGVVVMIKEFN